MNWKIAILETFAIMVCYMLVAWPLSSAATVNVMFNGQTHETVDVSPMNLMNKKITSEHESTDVTWSDVKVGVKISSASLSHTISKIYLYKCKTMDPVSCVMTEPQVFDKWIDTELAWKDISQREGSSPYPQVANLLLVIKMTGPNDRTSWVGSWDTIRRTEYNVFNTYSHEISSIDFHASSSELVEPAKLFMETYQMIPFNWADRVVFQGADSLYGLGAGDSELQSTPPQLQTAHTQSTEIDTINKDFYFVISETSSGKSMPATLNLNPSFTCGDGVCENDLGETKDNCCYDCGCLDSEYCDSSENKTGGCKSSDGISIRVQPLSIPSVSDCSVPFEAQFKLSFTNAPASLPDVLTAYLSLGNDVYTSSCTKGTGNQYNCPVTLTPSMSCGSDSEVIGPNTFNISLTYNDGPNTATKEMSTHFPDFTVTYDCACQSGFYCDAVAKKCQADGSIGLQVLNMTSYITDYNAAGDEIVVTAQITNPPGDMTTSGTAKYVLGSLYMQSSLKVNGTSGTAQCSGGASSGHIYTCRIPIHITDYNHEYPYYFKQNSFTMTVSYSNGGSQAVKELTAGLSDVTIPSYRCGDGTCNSEEDQDNCCADCGCSGSGQYCDNSRGCSYFNNISLSVLSVSPPNITDCLRTNVVELTAKLQNAPSGVSINYLYYFQGGELQPWALECSTPSTVTGITDCTLQVPEIEGCELPYYNIGPNSMNMSISFPDGNSGSVTKGLAALFPDIKLIPTYHCGQYGCETEFGESGDNCCIDCGCGSGEYCDYDSRYNPDGRCRAKSGIRLIIDSPTTQTIYDTCEKSQKLNVFAHINNQPSGMNLEGWYGTINGESTSMVVCDESSMLSTGTNKTYQCQIVIPSISECSKGDEWLYENNSLSLFISYTNGMGSRELQSLTSSLPPIRMNQGITSIYDITQDAISAMKSKLADTMQAMNDLLDVMDDCITMMLVSTMLMLGATLAIGFGGGKMESLKGTTFSDRVKAMSSATTAVTTAVNNICEMIMQSYKLMIEMYDVEMEMVQMQMCLDLYQHEMDTGNCDGREESCFSAIQSCINFGEIKNAMNDMESYFDSMQNDAMEIARAVDDFAETAEETGVFDGTGSARTATLTITQLNRQGSLGPGNPACDRYYSTSPTTNQKDWIVVKVSKPGTRCTAPIVTNTVTGGTETIICEGTECANKQIQIDFEDLPTTYLFKLYCFSSGSTNNDWNNQEKRADAYVSSIEVPVKRSSGDSCTTSGSGTTGGGTTVNAGAQASVSSAMAAISTITDTNFIDTKNAVTSRLSGANTEIGANRTQSAISVINEVINTLNNAKSRVGQTAKDKIDTAVGSLNTAISQLGGSSSSSTSSTTTILT